MFISGSNDQTAWIRYWFLKQVSTCISMIYKMILKKRFIPLFMWLCIGFSTLVSGQAPDTDLVDRFNRILSISPENTLSRSIEELKQFVIEHPDFRYRGNFVLAQRFVYDGRPTEGLDYFRNLPDERFAETIYGIQALYDLGYAIPDDEASALKDHILDQAVTWELVDMERQFMIDFVHDLNEPLPDEILSIPVTAETGHYRHAVALLKELAIEKLTAHIDAFPIHSDYLHMLAKIFPNTNGAMDQQMPLIKQLARAAEKARNPITALFLDTQIVSLQVNYGTISELDREEYDRIIEASDAIGFYTNHIDMVSTMALKYLFASDYEASLSYALKARELADQYHLVMQKGIYAGYAGICYANLAQYDKALASHQTACDALKDISPGWYWIWREKLAYIYMVMGDTRTSETIFHEVLEENLKSEFPLQAQYTYRNLAELYIQTGQLDKAAEYFSHVNENAFPGMARKNRAVAGQLAYARGNYREARRQLEACMNDTAPMDAPTQLDTWITLAATYRALNLNRMADTTFRDGVAFFEELARTRFRNIAFRRGFFQRYSRLYRDYVSFLAEDMNRPDRSWALVQHANTGPFQYFGSELKTHYQSLIPVSESNLPLLELAEQPANPALKDLIVRVEAVAGLEDGILLSGPGGIFRTDGILYTRISPMSDIFKLCTDPGQWAGISRQNLYINGEKQPLPEETDRVLTDIGFMNNWWIVASTHGLYAMQPGGTPVIILDEPVNCIARDDHKILASVPGKGLFQIPFDQNTWGEPRALTNTALPDHVIHLSPLPNGGFLAASHTHLFILDQHTQITRKQAVTGHILDRVTPMGTDSWLIQTALESWLLFDGQKLVRVDESDDRLQAGCGLDDLRFWSFENGIFVEKPASVQLLPHAPDAAGKHPSRLIQLDEETAAIGYPGAGIGLYRIRTGEPVGFFKNDMDNFCLNKLGFTVLGSNSQAVLYRGRPDGEYREIARYFVSSPVSALHQNADNSVMAGLIGGGFVHWTVGREPAFFGSANGLPTTSPVSTFTQQENGWFMGIGDTLYRFDGESATALSAFDTPVTTVAVADTDIITGTERAVYRYSGTLNTPVFPERTTGRVRQLHMARNMIIAVCENGVYLKNGAVFCQVRSPEPVRFIASDTHALLLVTDSALIPVADAVTPVLLQNGRDTFCIVQGSSTRVFRQDPTSEQFLDTGNPAMVPVFAAETEEFSIPTTERSSFSMVSIPPFRLPGPFTCSPALQKDGSLQDPATLQAGQHTLRIVGQSPFDADGVPVAIRVTRHISPAWIFAGGLLLLVGLLLTNRYIRWKRARYVGHYKLLGKLGEGGMGTVHKARDIRHNRTVALKILHRNVDPSFVERFKREWQMLDKLAHPNIIRVYDRGEHMEQFFIAMELLNGHPLDELLDRNGPFPEDVVIPIATSVAEALEAVHARQIIHRDLKPANIMLIQHSERVSGKIRPDHVKLMDFGVSKEALQEGLTSTGNLVGTLLYLAPESLSSLQTDSRSDIYALGVLMYELLTGMPPFYDENQASIYYKIINAPPPSFPEGIPVQEHLKQIIWRCLMKDPDLRYQTASDVRNALLELQR